MNRHDESLRNVVRIGNSASVRIILGAGANPDTRDADGTPLVSYAASKGKTTILRMLLERGADPNARDHQGDTPLHHAAASGHVMSIYALAEAGADPLLRNDHGKTPFECIEGNRWNTAYSAMRELHQTAASKASLKATFAMLADG